MKLATCASDALDRARVRELRGLLDIAFGGKFDDDDWSHALGGIHAFVTIDGEIVAHAAVVPRTIEVGDRPHAVGYVEAVATSHPHRHEGHGTTVMRAIADVIEAEHDFGALSTTTSGFYSTLGWEPWRGPTYAHTPEGVVRTADEDAGIMVLRTRNTPAIDETAALTCDWRTGDLW